MTTNTNATPIQALLSISRALTGKPAPAGFSLLSKGRTNKSTPTAIVTDLLVSCSNVEGALDAILPPATSYSTPAIHAAATKLLKQFAITHLIKSGEPLLLGASTLVTLTDEVLFKLIALAGLGERTAVSGSEIMAWMDCEAMQIIAQAHNWKPVHLERLTAMLKGYAAPAYKLSAEDAATLINRLSAFPELNSEPEAATLYIWLSSKLARDAAVATLMEGI